MLEGTTEREIRRCKHSDVVKRGIQYAGKTILQKVPPNESGDRKE
jgi:hypothetical protein